MKMNSMLEIKTDDLREANLVKNISTKKLTYFDKVNKNNRTQ